MGQTVAVVGASGYAGGELLRLIAGHPSLTVGPLVAGTSAGRAVAELHPHLTSLADLTFSEINLKAVQACDAVFMALPHGESAALVAQLPEQLPIVDLGADFRLEDSGAWGSYYGGEHAGTWTYGLPEIRDLRTQVATSHRVANPGCYATAVALAAAPAVSESLCETTDIVVMAASGTTGAGRAAKPNLQASEVMGSLNAYKLGGAHQHTPEIEQTLRRVAGKPVVLSFTPVLAPMPRGILATVSMSATPGVPLEEIRDVYAHWYRSEPFVRVLPQDQLPRTADVVGTNVAHLHVSLDEHAHRLTVIITIDNLGKGASGQAIQNANLMLGFPEDAGLNVDGLAP